MLPELSMQLRVLRHGERDVANRPLHAEHERPVGRYLFPLEPMYVSQLRRSARRRRKVDPREMPIRRVCWVVLAGVLGTAQPSVAQSADSIQALRRDIEELRQTQAATLREVQAIRR